MKKPLYLAIAGLMEQKHNLENQHALGNAGRRVEILNHVDGELNRLVREHLPSGSGFDNGTRLIRDVYTPAQLWFKTDFHHMSEHGYYDGWSEHTVIVTPAWGGFDLRVTGRDRNNIKDYIAEVFHLVLRREVEYEPVPAPRGDKTE